MLSYLPLVVLRFTFLHLFGSTSTWHSNISVLPHCFVLRTILQVLLHQVKHTSFVVCSATFLSSPLSNCSPHNNEWGLTSLLPHLSILIDVILFSKNVSIYLCYILYLFIYIALPSLQLHGFDTLHNSRLIYIFSFVSLSS
jgi:hypothetical protein